MNPEFKKQILNRIEEIVTESNDSGKNNILHYVIIAKALTYIDPEM